MTDAQTSPIAVCLALSRAIARARSLDDIYTASLDTLGRGLRISRSSILLFDPDGVMRFKAHRGLSAGYRQAVEGHTPWTPDSVDPQPLIVGNVTEEPSLATLLPTITAENIAAMAFIPLVSMGRVIGKFMLYHDRPYVIEGDELQLAEVIAAEVAFAIQRTRAEELARRSEERLVFALDAASMGTWEWDLSSNTVRWSDNLERVHGLPPGTFDGTFASYEREIHPEDRERVLAAARRAINEGVPYEVEYRIVAPDGTVRWVEGKGLVEFRDSKPVRMTGVCMIVTARKEAELARLASAEEANQLKDEFLATLSHELRTPLNAILGWIHMLQGDSLSPDRARHALDIVGRNAKLQAQLIEDILDISRIIKGKLEIERRPLNPTHVIDTVIDGAMPLAAARQIELVSQIPRDLPPIEGDAKRLQQVLGNVVSNAIKFTPPGGRIEVRCTRDDDALCVTVIDTGLGIDTDLLPFIFDRFRQGDSRSTRNHGGLGLGLAIAHHIVERHQGEIRAHSDGPGRGARFEIRLPIASAVRVDMDRTPHDAAPLHLDDMTVLVVDDQQDSRELLATIFEQCGAEVVQCDSVDSAMRALVSARVDLLLADIAMPDADGYELISRVRRLDDERANVPAIVVSAYARLEDRHRAFAAGFNGYCSKPVETLELLRVVSSVLRTANEPVRDIT